jgi:energy-coupling factor transporter ATP-binding protein EcfA2
LAPTQLDDSGLGVQIELSNYRAFDDGHPVRWTLCDGFTAFVGANNAGKSSLLRFFHEVRPALNAIYWGDARSQDAWSGTPTAYSLQGVADLEEVFCNRNNRDLTLTLRLLKPARNDRVGIFEPSVVRLRLQRPDARVTIEAEHNGTIYRPASAGGSIDSNGRFRSETGGHPMTVDVRRFREAARELEKIVYLGPFRNAINVGTKADYFDLQIGEAFIKQWDAFKTGPNRAQNRRARDVEKELAQIFGLQSLEINAAPGDETLVVFVDDLPYQLSEQGAGLAQFILVFAFVATRESSWIFIDEPELNLHPSLQIDFLTSLAAYAARGVVFATHSIGLARAIAQDVHSVVRLDDGSTEVRDLAGTRDYGEFLGELSLSGYNELGFQRVLLVEGTTEVPVLQRWLRLYGIEHEVVLLPLGGSSLINGTSAQALAEIGRITDCVSVLIDSERSVGGETLAPGRQAFVDECKRLGFDIHVLERRAIENYLTDDAVKSVKGANCTALGPFDPRPSAGPGWGKRENWRIAAKMTREDLDTSDLGSFLAGLAAICAAKD